MTESACACKKCENCGGDKSSTGRKPKQLELFTDPCDVVLPAKPVFERIEFEQFLLLQKKIGDFDVPIVLTLSREEVSEIVRPVELFADVAGPEPDALAHVIGMSGGVPLDIAMRDAALRPDIAQLATSWGTVFESAKRQDLIRTDAQEVFQNVDPASFRLALHLPFVQQWVQRGYSRGRMLNSISLGPGEQQTIEIFTWDRTKTSTESVFTVEAEKTSESQTTQRDARDVAREVSNQAGFELTTNAKVGFNTGVVSGDFGAGGSAKDAFSAVEKTTINSISEATQRATSSVRTSRTLKVTQTREFGREERVTRVLKNSSDCNTLTTSFFEILTHYLVSTTLDAAHTQLVALIPATDLDAPRYFTAENVRYYESALRGALLTTSFDAGFDAARLLYSYDHTCEILCKGCKCEADTAQPQAGLPEFEKVKEAMLAVEQSATRLDASTTFPQSVVYSKIGIPPWDGAVLGDQPSCADIRRYLAKKYVRDTLPTLFAEISGLPNAAANITAADADRLGGVVSRFLPERIAGMTYDDATAGAVTNEIRLYIITTPGLWPHDPLLALALVEAVKSNVNFSRFDDGGLAAALQAYAAAYAAWQAAVKAAAGDTERDREIKRINDEDRARRMFDLYPPKDVADAQERLSALLFHLNDQRNIDHYRFAVWAERGTLYDAQLLAWAQLGIIEPRVVGLVGENVAVPVNTTNRPLAAKRVADLLAAIPAEQRNVTKKNILPTGAVYAEASAGRCDACDPITQQQRTLDVEGRRVAVELEKAELARREARLRTIPPQLGADLPAALPLSVVLHDEREQ